MNPQVKKEWDDLKKVMTWENFKALIPALLLLSGFFYLYTRWMKLVTPLLDEYSKAINSMVPISQHDALLSLCVLIGFVAPLFFCFPVMSFSFWLSRTLKLYNDDKTRYLFFDDVGYYIKDLPQDQRDKIKEIVANYKSKEQLRREQREKLSLIRRIFT